MWKTQKHIKYFFKGPGSGIICYIFDHLCFCVSAFAFSGRQLRQKPLRYLKSLRPGAKHQQQRRATKKGWVPCRNIGYNWLLNMGSYHEQFLESGQQNRCNYSILLHNINTTLESQVLYTWSHQPMIKRYPVSTTSAWSIGCLSSTWNLNIVSFHIRFWKYKMSPKKIPHLLWETHEISVNTIFWQMAVRCNSHLISFTL